LVHLYGPKKYPSVTKILDEMVPEPPAVTRWKQRTPNWRRDFAEKGKVGTIVHFRILNPLSTSRLELPEFGFSDFPENAKDLADIGEILFKSKNIVFEDERYVERSVVSDKHKYGGKVDLLARIKFPDRDRSPLVLIDIKTSKTAYDKHFLQLGGYYNALVEEGLEPDEGAIIIVHPYVKSNPRLEAHLYPISKQTMEKDASAFLELVEQFYEEERHLKIPGCLPGIARRYPAKISGEKETETTGQPTSGPKSKPHRASPMKTNSTKEAISCELVSQE
jgi:hypothetical protein